jgi:hypothetical protein
VIMSQAAIERAIRQLIDAGLVEEGRYINFFRSQKDRLSIFVPATDHYRCPSTSDRISAMKPSRCAIILACLGSVSFVQRCHWKGEGTAVERCLACEADVPVN